MLIPLLRPAHNQPTSLALQRFPLLFESSCLGQWMTLTMLHWAEWKSSTVQSNTSDVKHRIIFPYPFIPEHLPLIVVPLQFDAVQSAPHDPDFVLNIIVDVLMYVLPLIRARLEWSSMVHRFMCKHTAGRKPPPCHLVISLSHYLATPPSPTSHCGVETVSLLLGQCTLHKQNCIQEDNKELHKGGRDSRVWLLTLSRGLSWTRSDMLISGPILLATHRLIWVTNETVTMHSCLQWTTRASSSDSYTRLAHAVVF